MDASPTSPTDTNASLDTVAATCSALATAIATPDDVEMKDTRGEEVTLYETFNEDRPLYHPCGKWAWADGLEILNHDTDTRLSSGFEGTADLKVCQIGGKEALFMPKSYSVWDRLSRFLPYLFLHANCSYLRQLQGVCVPYIIGVIRCREERMVIVQDLPHATGWREADAFLEQPQKQAILDAYQKIHDQGILHGAAEYRQWLIGDDGKVAITDFGFSRVLHPDEHARQANLAPCTRDEISDEMRKVRFLLDYEDSRRTEYRLAEWSRDQKDKAPGGGMRLSHSEGSDPAVEVETFILEAMFPALLPSDLDHWSTAGDSWTAHRYDIIRSEGCPSVKVLKSVVPRHSNLEQPATVIPPVTSKVSTPDRAAPTDPRTPSSLSSPPAADSEASSSAQSTRPRAMFSDPKERRHYIGPHSHNSGAVRHLKRSRMQDSDDEDADTDVESDLELSSSSSSDSDDLEFMPDLGSDSDEDIVDGLKRNRQGKELARKRRRLSETASASTEATTSSTKVPRSVDNAPPQPAGSPEASAASAAGPQKPRQMTSPPITRSNAILDLSYLSETSSNTGASSPRRDPTAPKHVGHSLLQPASTAAAAAPPQRTFFESLGGQKAKLNAVCQAAWDAWQQFSDARELLESLQARADCQKLVAERRRDAVLRTLFSVSGNDRRDILDALALEDSLSMLELYPDRPAPGPSAILRDRRAKIAGGVVQAHLTRPPGRPVIIRKQNPRVADIKRGLRIGYKVTAPSKLGTPSRAPRIQCRPRVAPESPAELPQSDRVSRASSQAEVSVKKAAKVKASVEKVMKWTQAMIQRVEKQEEKAGMPSSPQRHDEPQQMSSEQAQREHERGDMSSCRASESSSSPTSPIPPQPGRMPPPSPPEVHHMRPSMAACKAALSELKMSKMKTSKIPTPLEVVVFKQPRTTKRNSNPETTVIENSAGNGTSTLHTGKRKREELDNSMGLEERERKMPRCGLT